MPHPIRSGTGCGQRAACAGSSTCRLEGRRPPHQCACPLEDVRVSGPQRPDLNHPADRRRRSDLARVVGLVRERVGFPRGRERAGEVAEVQWLRTRSAFASTRIARSSVSASALTRRSCWRRCPTSPSPGAARRLPARRLVGAVEAARPDSPCDHVRAGLGVDGRGQQPPFRSPIRLGTGSEANGRSGQLGGDRGLSAPECDRSGGSELSGGRLRFRQARLASWSARSTGSSRPPARTWCSPRRSSGPSRDCAPAASSGCVKRTVSPSTSSRPAVTASSRPASASRRSSRRIVADGKRLTRPRSLSECSETLPSRSETSSSRGRDRTSAPSSRTPRSRSSPRQSSSA